MTAHTDLETRLQSYRRRYSRSLKDLQQMISSELAHLEDDNFEPSSAIESGAFHLIQNNNRLKALLEVDP